MHRVCRQLGIHPDIYYAWRKSDRTAPKTPGGPPPAPELIRAMIDDVRRLCHKARRTWATETIYREYQDLIPHRVIARAIRLERSERNRIRRANALRYEFTAVGIAWSIDYIKVGGGGRVPRLHEEKSRYEISHEYRCTWDGKSTADWVESLFERHGRPYIMKHDLGGEPRRREFQEMLERNLIIPLPNPLWYAQANGKHERVNRDVRQWLLPLKIEGAPQKDVLDEVDLAVEDLNYVRPREILKYRTSYEVFVSSPRLDLDRQAMYGRWQDTYGQLRFKSPCMQSIMAPVYLDFAAERLAAKAVLQPTVF